MGIYGYFMNGRMGKFQNECMYIQNFGTLNVSILLTCIPLYISFADRRYHGNLSREEAMEALGSLDGCYLVRSGSDGDNILSFM